MPSFRSPPSPRAVPRIAPFPSKGVAVKAMTSSSSDVVVKPIPSKKSLSNSNETPKTGPEFSERTLSGKNRSFAKIAATAVSRSGVLSTVVYVFMATVLAVSTWGMDSLANKPINLGVVEQAWTHDIFDIPIHTFMKGKTTFAEVKKNLAVNLTYGTLSLSDVQYDDCPGRDDACTEKVRPDHERVMYLLGSSFNLISGFELPQFVAQVDKIEFQYVNTLSGFNAPAIQYFIPGEAFAVVCTARRNRYKIAQETTAGEIDSVAMCSKRAYDPDWGCENEVSMDTPTYFFRINQGKVTYLGQAARRETYYNPGNIAKLSGGPQGTGFLSTVIGIDEYNSGILTASAPWDSTPAYLCKGTFDPVTNTGMRWQGQGRVSMNWQSTSLMVTNSLVLWALTSSLAVMQFLYLPRSSVCVIPVNLAKTIVGPIVLGYACYGNYNAQVLTTYFETNKVTSFNAEPYRLCGPAMIASVVGIMSGTAIQMTYNPLLVSPSYLLTLVSVANWIIVFVLEAYVFPKQSTMLIQKCGLPSSTNCSYYSATLKNYYLSPIIAACAVVVGVVIIGIIRHRTRRSAVNGKNSMLKVFGVKSLRELATSDAGGSVKFSDTGLLMLDAGVLLEKNLVRVSETSIVRTEMVKYAIMYMLLPPFLSYPLSRAVGLVLVVHADGDQVVGKLSFKELKDMKLHTGWSLPAYYQ